ncbi:DgyrCDS1854 [Dimorphilus gyrociliatus]|uniref:DgyrCDS1854 n=1 Tax=Dimorphilus gyrociliatus TaxID=2664684 RepID=A0A7I8VAD3_9ANNE|nr:DgyrCDS1854 [Dimorphilus gyrociliatus]
MNVLKKTCLILFLLVAVLSYIQSKPKGARVFCDDGSACDDGGMCCEDGGCCPPTARVCCSDGISCCPSEFPVCCEGKCCNSGYLCSDGTCASPGEELRKFQAKKIPALSKYSRNNSTLH